MTYQEILANARTCMGPYCKSCPTCNGLACKNTVPGPGAKGIGTGFIRNYQKWQELCVNMDTICENKPVDTSFELFGHKVALPVFAAPVGAMQLHYGDKYDDLAYNDILVTACAQAGAGHVRQHHIRLLHPCRVAFPPIGQRRAHDGNAQPRRAVFDELQLVGVDIAGQDVSPVAHLHRHSEGLAARCGAHVQHPVAGRRSRGHSRQPRRGVLHRAAPLRKGGQPLQVARTGDLKAAGQLRRKEMMEKGQL